MHLYFYVLILDINECLDHNGGCNHMCINTPGSYYCSCNSGYELQADKHNCTGICKTLQNYIRK